MTLLSDIAAAVDGIKDADALRTIPEDSKPGRKKRAKKAPDPPKHLVIPDTQVAPGVPTIHLEWIGQYIVDEFVGEDLRIIHLGDHWDLPSLSSYDRGKSLMEGRRVAKDIEAGNRGFDLLNYALARHNTEHPRKQWWPERDIFFGNHENRITRAIEEHAQLDGLLSLDLLNAKRHGWTVHDFLDVATIDGVAYCLAPDHKVLMADLEYVAVGSLEVGDELVGFAEEGIPRKYETSVVTRTSRTSAPLYEVLLAGGRRFRATAEHRWLARRYGTTGWRWVHTHELDSRYELCHPFDTWERDTSWEAGWLAGLLDGEGWISKPNTKQGGIQVGFAQNPGRVLDLALELLDRMKVRYTVHNQGRDCLGVRIGGTSADKLSFLGRIGSVRLIDKFRAEMLGRVQTNGGADDVVVSVSPIGTDEIVQLETSTGTLIVEGYAHHNSHYFYNPMSGRPYAGQNVETRLKTIGHSFTMGHQQVLLYGVRTTIKGLQHGLVAGSCYLHDEEYRGPQGNAEWRGIVLCNQVENGSYDPSFISLDYLARRYEGMRLSELMEKL